MELNEEQKKASQMITRFLAGKHQFFLLMAPAGTGKTTLVTQVLCEMKKRCVFSAFTNKATRILESKSTNDMTFVTIHKLLRLRPKINDNELEFDFDPIEAKAFISAFEVAVIDECSTISADLYDKLMSLFKEVNVKVIFLGDYWQLPPVSEEKSLVFTENTGWYISKLTKIMRSRNPTITKLNALLSSKTNQYPYGIFDVVKPIDMDAFISEYIKNPESSIILTYSINKCKEINEIIQKTIHGNNFDGKFKAGDRVTVQRTVQKAIWEFIHESKLYYQTENTELDYVYGAETMIVDKVENVKCIVFGKYIVAAQKLTISNKIYFHLDQGHISTAKKTMRLKLRKKAYEDVVSKFNQSNTVFVFGHALTLYKAQGSEWNNVFIEMNNIYWCNRYNKIKLLECVYTAITRARDKVILYTK